MRLLHCHFRNKTYYEDIRGKLVLLRTIILCNLLNSFMNYNRLYIQRGLCNFPSVSLDGYRDILYVIIRA